MTVCARVIYQDLEGGFWALEADDGRKLYPVDGLPSDFQTPGLRVEVEAEAADVFTTAMWGENVRLHEIRPL